jgi:hypothetical protein
MENIIKWLSCSYKYTTVCFISGKKIYLEENIANWDNFEKLVKKLSKFDFDREKTAVFRGCQYYPSMENKRKKLIKMIRNGEFED